MINKIKAYLGPRVVDDIQDWWQWASTYANGAIASVVSSLVSFSGDFLFLAVLIPWGPVRFLVIFAIVFAMLFGARVLKQEEKDG